MEWKETPECLSAKECFDKSLKTVSYRLIHHDSAGNAWKHRLVSDLPSYTLYGPPANEEISYANAIGWNAIGQGTVYLAVGDYTVYMTLIVQVGAYEYLNENYYVVDPKSLKRS